MQKTLIGMKTKAFWNFVEKIFERESEIGTLGPQAATYF